MFFIHVADIKAEEGQDLVDIAFVDEAQAVELREARFGFPVFEVAYPIVKDVVSRVLLLFHNLLAESLDVANGQMPSFALRAETFNIPPRHFHKIVTFCAAYSLHLHKILETLRLSLQDSGQEPIPHLLTGRPLPAMVETPAEADEVEQTGFLGELVAELGDVPFFLRETLKTVSGLTRPSLKDFFWIGTTGSAYDPYLGGGLLAVVNRQKKKPNDCGSKPLWQQPLYVILKRDGTYLCGCCSRENNSLVVHSYPGGVHKRDQFRNRDAEVIGKIVTVVRRLS